MTRLCAITSCRGLTSTSLGRTKMSLKRRGEQALRRRDRYKRRVVKLVRGVASLYHTAPRTSRGDGASHTVAERENVSNLVCIRITISALVVWLRSERVVRTVVTGKKRAAISRDGVGLGRSSHTGRSSITRSLAEL